MGWSRRHDHCRRIRTPRAAAGLAADSMSRRWRCSWRSCSSCARLLASAPPPLSRRRRLSGASSSPESSAQPGSSASLCRGCAEAAAVATQQPSLLLPHALAPRYYPEVTHGYNASCGYTSSGLLNLVPGPKGSPLPAFSCGGYSPAGMLSGFRFAHLPEAWMTTVLQALAAAAATGTLSFTPGGAAGAGIQLFNASSFGASAAAVPLWTFEPTVRACCASRFCCSAPKAPSSSAPCPASCAAPLPSPPSSAQQQLMPASSRAAALRRSLRRSGASLCGPRTPGAPPSASSATTPCQRPTLSARATPTPSAPWRQKSRRCKARSDSQRRSRRRAAAAGTETAPFPAPPGSGMRRAPSPCGS